MVGASDVGISILENLSFCPHLRFNNLTLISKRGLPRSLHSVANVYDSDEMAQISLRSWVNVVTGDALTPDFNWNCFSNVRRADVFRCCFSMSSDISFTYGSGVMVGIDRSHQEVVMKDGTTLPYDHLILCTGQQFQVSDMNESAA